MKTRTTDSGESVHVDEVAAEVGSKGPFYAVYVPDDRAERYGYRCSGSGTLGNAMDTVGRIACN